MRDVGLDANAGHRTLIKIQNKMEQKCRKRNAHIKVIQNGLKSKHQTMKLFKTGILPAVASGHAGMGMCPCSFQRKRTMAVDSCIKRIKTACTTTILHFHFGKTGTQVSGFRWTSFGLGSSSKAKKMDTDRRRLTSHVRGPLRLLV